MSAPTRGAETQPSPLRLENDELVIEVDPGHGAEVLVLAQQPHRENLLWRAPWAPAPPRSGPLMEKDWIAGYRGGWQEVFPNAGNPCTYDGRFHGFHGEASNSSWEVLEHDRESTRLRWDDGGLRLERHIRVGPGPVVRYDELVTVPGDHPRAFIWVHHPAFGGPLIRPGCSLDVPAGRAYTLDEQTGPTRPPTTADRWPTVGGEDWSTVKAESTVVRFGCLTDLEGGWAAIRNQEADLGVGLAWPVEVFPHLWTYQDVHGVPDEPWRGSGEFVMLEPASVPHSLGLAAAAAESQVMRLQPGEELASWLTVTLFRPRGRVAGVSRDGRVEHAI